MSGNNDRSVSQLQDDAKRTRNKLDDTLSAIEHRLSPGQLMEDGLHYLRHNGATEYVANLGDTAKRDPIPLALVGVGLAWLMMSSRRGPVDGDGAVSASTGAISSGVRDTVSGVKDAASGVRDAASGVRDTVFDTFSSVKSRVSQTTQKLSDAAKSAGEGTRQVGNVARQGAERVRSSYDYLVNEQPLAFGAIGLALGAALAAAAPRTRQDDRLLGDASDGLAEEVKTTGREQLDKVKDAATAAEEAVRDSLGAPAPAKAEGEVSKLPPPDSKPGDPDVRVSTALKT